jgi:hypothetical protein
MHSQCLLLYTLRYTPTATDAEGYHESKVDVDRANLKVSSRPGYHREGAQS